MKDVINRLNKIEEDNVELKQDNLELKRENIELKNQVQTLIQEQEMCKNNNILQRMSSIESDMDIILRKNGKGKYYFSGKNI